MSYQQILVIGGTSTIATALLHQLAPKGSVILAGRHKQRLDATAAALRTRHGCNVQTAQIDLAVREGAQQLETLFKQHPLFDLVILAQGHMPEVGDSLSNLEELYHVNLFSVTQAIHLAATLTSACDILVMGSVAGTRGRPGNFPYGSAKAALTVFCEGYRSRLSGGTHHLLLAQLGRVSSAMTGFAKGASFSEPEKVARSIARQLRRRKPLVYHTAKWKWIHRILRLLPTRLLPK